MGGGKSRALTMAAGFAVRLEDRQTRSASPLLEGSRSLQSSTKFRMERLPNERSLLSLIPLPLLLLLTLLFVSSLLAHAL